MKDSTWVRFSIRHPKLIFALTGLATLLLASLISMVKVDTDPENMLSLREPVRIFHNQTKKEFTLYDAVIIGVVNEKDPDGVFNPHTLKRIQELTEFSRSLADPRNPEKRVVSREVIAPGNVDSIEQAGLGQVSFSWLMPEAPETREAALKIRDSAMANPLFRGTMVSEDGKALCIYLPLTAKDFAYQVRERVLEKIATFSGDEEYHITGLPVAEDTFGVEMFVQMAVSAPLAMLAILLLMLLFFKHFKMIISPMIVAVVTVICTMGLLIGSGNTLHIMSSMIPIFLMPIAVVDSIHIMSEFFDTYGRTRDREQTLKEVMGHLFLPMLYTSLTSTAGFASLTLTPIPPVQTFGLFVAIGIMLAWLLTVLFIPAYIMILDEKSLADLGQTSKTGAGSSAFMGRHLHWLKNFTFNRAKLILAATALTLMVSGYGISRIEINDNPINWFSKKHPIRVADQVLNRHFGGTHEAFLVLESLEPPLTPAAAAGIIDKKLTRLELPPGEGSRLAAARELLRQTEQEETELEPFLQKVTLEWEKHLDAADDAAYETWVLFLDQLAAVKDRDQIFKQPAVLEYLALLQEHLQKIGVVGKSNSLADIVKKIYLELYEGDPAYYRIPETTGAVAQSLISFQNSHKPDDLFHFVTPDYRKANLWLQLKSGDNQEMEEVIEAVALFFQEHPPPVALSHQWAGLTYINVIWQEKMVKGMIESFLGSFVIVFLMMAFLFRSPLWGILAMAPLTVTIAFIYGIIGFVGKEYDMPVAVLSSLTLGLAVDFAIHFLERSRMAYRKHGSWKGALDEMFEEPGRAITRNVIVIAVGFTPLLAAPLVPYKTVGFFLASIMAVSGIGTMFILPALLRLMESVLFKKFNREKRS
jgi:hypothetical protein